MRLLAGYFGCLTGEFNAGKAVTPILGLAAFGIVFGGLFTLPIPIGWAIGLSALAALNPVIIYQSSSYYVDGQVAGLFTVAVFLGIRALMLPAKNLEKLLFLISLGFLAAAKTSGIFYGLCLFMVMGTIWVIHQPKTTRAILLAGAFITDCP